MRSKRWNGSAWVDVAANQVINNNPNRLLSVAMPPDGLIVATLAAPVAAGINSIDVFEKRLGNANWLAVAPTFPFGAAGELVGPMRVEFATGTSPIVVYVSRNSLGEYNWWTLRYYPPP